MADRSFGEAVALHRGGSIAAAETAYRRVLKQYPRHVNALHLLGVIAYQRGDFVGAARLVGEAVAIEPRFAEAHDNLGAALTALGRIDEAVAAHRRSIQLKPDSTAAFNNLGIALRRQGKADEAAAAYRRAIALNPGNAGAYNNLGLLLTDQRDLEAATAACRRAIEINPQYAEAHNNLGIALREQGHLDDAVVALRRALEIRPDVAEVFGNLGNVYWAQGGIESSIQAIRRSLELSPENAATHSSLLLCMGYDAGVSAAEILEESRRWDAAHAAPLAGRAQSPANDPDPGRRLRIGYVSPDFRQHPASYSIEPMLAAHDRCAVEVFCFAEVTRPDVVTARYRENADHWRSTVGMSNAQVAECVRRDRIDILVDLAGHTAGHRLLAFAERPAPVQVGHMAGLAQTTGMTAIDYLLSDRWLTPPEADGDFSENPWRLDRCYLSFEPDPAWPAISPLPARTRGHITFASFCHPTRISLPTVAMWSRALEAVPGSRLILKHGFYSDATVRSRTAAAFAAEGVGDRVEIRGVERGWLAEMDVYGEVDIALDCAPRNGGTTTFIALWMGLPVVASGGSTASARMGHSYLSAVGLEEGIARDAAEFPTVASRLAADLDHLAELRAGMRQRLGASPLLDHAGLARAIEDAYRGMWRKWCAEHGAT